MKIKVYKYSSASPNYRGTELTNMLLLGTQDTEDLTEELDTTAITLQGSTLPSIPYTPSEKFILDLYDNDDASGDPYTTLYRVVMNDYVSKVILDTTSDTTCYKHEITLIEPSSIAQSRLVDDISTTYKLKDVSLNTLLAFDPNEANPQPTSTDIFPPKQNFTYGYFGKYFQWSGSVKAVNRNGVEYDLHYLDVANFPNNEISFKIPDLSMYLAKIGTQQFVNVGRVSVWYKIVCLNSRDEVVHEQSGVCESNDKLNQTIVAPYFDNLTIHSEADIRVKESGVVEFYYAKQSIFPIATPDYLAYKRYTNSLLATYPSHIVAFNEPIQDGYNYEITIYPYVYTTYEANLPINVKGYVGQPINLSRMVSTERTLYDGSTLYGISPENIECSLNNTNITQTNVAFAQSNISEFMQSALPYTVYDMIAKAIVNTETKRKKTGVAVYDINHKDSNGNYDYPSAFYIDPNFMDIVKSTQIIESEFHQKNLWEVLLEAGYYIHCIPEIVFGENDKLMITFLKLGETAETTDQTSVQSITSFRGIDDYIAETSSYVQNLVQLGGYIDEWVHISTEDEDKLAYNDNIVLKTSKPIIELLGFQIKCNSSSYTDIGISLNETTIIQGTGYSNALNFLYEHSIYNLLSIRFNDTPNKGIAMFYNLGESTLYGATYQLPRDNYDVYEDYALKKIIYVAFNNSYPINHETETAGLWSKIKMCDFTYRIIYRTQDAVRLEHCRPDLRKYLMNSTFDDFPQHRQFNNQTETMLDSNRIGQNIYGKLIRTGNNNYTRTIHCYSMGDMLHKGNLVTIDGVRYYVAKAINTYFANCIIQEVTYSQDYNQLSKVIGIPSEPRFYEISERNVIRRDVSINDFLLVTTDINNLDRSSKRMIKNTSHLFNLVMGSDTQVEFAKYVITTFKGDKDIGNNYKTLGDASHHVDIISPVNAYTCGATLTYEWDMVDNYSAGDMLDGYGVVDEHDTKYVTLSSNNYYRALRAVKYCDKYGKAPLFDFFLLKTASFTGTEINKFPQSPISTNNPSATRYISGESVLATNLETDNTDYNGRGLSLFKDNREAISFNYNIQLITDSDRFVVSPYFYTPKVDANNTPVIVQVALVTEEVNKLSSGLINTSTIYRVDTPSITPYSDTDPFGVTRDSVWSLNLSSMYTIEQLQGYGVKAIAMTIGYNQQSLQTKYSLAYNIGGLTSLTNIYFGNAKKQFFTNYQ